VKAPELAFELETIVLRALKRLKISRAKLVTDDIVRDLMHIIPSEAYDIKQAWERGILFFHGEVTEEYVRDMQGEIATVHSNIDKSIPITLYLSSIGGSWDSGLALYSTIQDVRRGGRKVICHIQGVAMSMGSVLAQACDERTIEPHATVMIHETYDTVSGKMGEIEDALVYAKRVDASLCSIYSSRSGKPVDYWRDKMSRRDWYMTAREAVNEGLVDRIKPIIPFKSKKVKQNKKESE
jgi:ATP-dependent Clp endopeptidase proteolytic subunit ClpP